MKTVLQKFVPAEASGPLHGLAGSAIAWARPDSFHGNFTSAALTTPRPCPVCGGANSRVVTSLRDFQFYTDSAEVPKLVDINQCQCLDCLALYTNPCYSEYGFEVLFAEAGCSYGTSAERYAERVRWLAKRGLLKPGTEVLDVGCYDGSFLSRLPEEVGRVGVDLDAPAIGRGRARYGRREIEFIVGDFETFRPDGAPDLVTMFHVLEHLPRPVSVLANLRSVAHSGTRIVVEVPILEDGGTNDINGFFSAMHMTHFSRRSFENTFLCAGWRITERIEQPNPGYNGYRILAEPGEAARTVEGDTKDMALLHQYLSSWHGALKAANEALERCGDAPCCVIWGGGLHTEFLYHTTSFFHADRKRRYVIVDSDPLKHGRTWRGIPVYGPRILSGMDWRQSVLLISSYGSQEAIRSEARKLDVPEERIVAIYGPRDPQTTFQRRKQT